MAPIQVCKFWIDPILDFLKYGTLPEEKKAAKKIKYISNKYLIVDENLFKRGYVIPFIACLHPHQAQAALLEIHEGLCGGHPAARSLAWMIGRQGYFWPTILRDAQELVPKCDKCQRFANIQYLLAEPMTPVSSPRPFSKWLVEHDKLLFLGFSCPPRVVPLYIDPSPLLFAIPKIVLLISFFYKIPD